MRAWGPAGAQPVGEKVRRDRLPGCVVEGAVGDLVVLPEETLSGPEMLVCPVQAEGRDYRIRRDRLKSSCH